MKKLTKNQKKLVEAYDFSKKYELEEAIDLVKKTNYTKFDPSIDIVIRLGVDPKKVDQMIRSFVTLPYSTGKKNKVLVLCNSDKEQEVISAGADYVGCDEYIKKIKNGWLEVDSIISTPDVMPQVAQLGRKLGPKGLMPSLKLGTVVPNPSQVVKEIKDGRRVGFKVDSGSNVHVKVGKVSLSNEQLKENCIEVLGVLNRTKPSTVKGVYIQAISLSSTMGKGVGVKKW